MKRKIRVGILTHNYPSISTDRKDAGIFIYDFANELAKKTDVFVLCPDFGGKKEKYKKVPVTWFRWDKKNEKFGNWKLFSPIYVFKFFKLIYIGQKESIKFVKENKLDYCLSCWTLPSAIFAYRVNKVLKIPYAVWSLGSDVNKYVKIPILGQLISLSMKSANKLYANSYLLCSKVKAISGKKCDFMPAITNFKLTKVAKIALSKNKFNFLYVGRLENVKGPDVLIEAVKILVKNNKKFTVNILGDGTMMKSLKSKSENLGRVINFIGWADESMVGGYMKKCDSLVIPSRSESLPLVMIEAAKVKLPVVATNVGDCDRVIRKYKIGISTEKENPASLANAMQEMMKKRSLYKKGKFVEMTKDFSQEKTVNDFLMNMKI